MALCRVTVRGTLGDPIYGFNFMSNIVISGENLSKRYRLGIVDTGTFYGDLKSWWARQRGKPDPYLKIGETDHGNRDGETIWALRDVNFTVCQGETLGIIGRNGAGKSTLLKILSQVTAPTSGVVKVKGRISSLLEVGTGFHPELTGRENMYLNGAIMGMDRSEVERKFDEIVDFSGVETFIDTPVKRYSSGMYVRLAFAVAAHLEPEILVVDEVLAVGDAEFQKKCLGKMQDVAGEGRTVIFVSHNMGAIQSICQRAILLNKGVVEIDSSASQAITHYLQDGSISTDGKFYRNNFDTKKHLIESVELCNSAGERTLVFEYGESLHAVITTNPVLDKKFGFHIRVKNSKHDLISFLSSWISSDGPFMAGETILVEVPNLQLVQDTYYLDFICNIPNIEHIDNWWDSIYFKVGVCRPGNMPFAVSRSNNLGSTIIGDPKIYSE